MPRTFLYQLIEQHYLAFITQLAAQGSILPSYVQREFEETLKCGRLEHGFLRVCCETCHAEHLVAFSCKRRGFCPSCGAARSNSWDTRIISNQTRPGKLYKKNNSPAPKKSEELNSRSALFYP